jgi:hypothetical protein
MLPIGESWKPCVGVRKAFAECPLRTDLRKSLIDFLLVEKPVNDICACVEPKSRRLVAIEDRVKETLNGDR